MTTTGIGGHGEWILDLIAFCRTCGVYLTRHVGGPRRRLYTCPCGHLRDAQILESAVVVAVADRLWRANPRDLVRPPFVVYRWRTAAPAEQRDLIRSHVAAVTVDDVGQADIRWCRAAPAEQVPVTTGRAARGVCRPDGRSRRG